MQFKKKHARNGFLKVFGILTILNSQKTYTHYCYVHEKIAWYIITTANSLAPSKKHLSCVSGQDFSFLNSSPHVFNVVRFGYNYFEELT